jgi:hypothetical protein
MTEFARVDGERVWYPGTKDAEQVAMFEE